MSLNKILQKRSTSSTNKKHCCYTEPNKRSKSQQPQSIEPDDLMTHKILSNFLPCFLLVYQTKEASKVIDLLNTKLHSVIYKKKLNSSEEEAKINKQKDEDLKQTQEFNSKVESQLCEAINKANTVLEKSGHSNSNGNSGDNRVSTYDKKTLPVINRNDINTNITSNASFTSIGNGNSNNKSRTLTAKSTSSYFLNKTQMQNKEVSEMVDSSCLDEYFESISSTKELLAQTKEKLSTKNIQLKKVSKVFKEKLVKSIGESMIMIQSSTTKAPKKSKENIKVGTADTNTDTNTEKGISRDSRVLLTKSIYLFLGSLLNHSIFNSLFTNYNTFKELLPSEETLSLWITSKIMLRIIEALNKQNNTLPVLNAVFKDKDIDIDNQSEDNPKQKLKQSSYEKELRVTEQCREAALYRTIDSTVHRWSISLISSLLTSIQSKSSMNKDSQVTFNDLHGILINRFNSHITNFCSEYLTVTLNKQDKQEGLVSRTGPNTDTLLKMKDLYSVIFNKAQSSFYCTDKKANKRVIKSNKFEV
eukprot:CAMPEP_0170520302 /NCGR_PEP_ID=MMETSP0209-20121228/5561_1 /TAXON_ID=665100 ORGANISM="Litonotus pictus, Strain P1" /NCGR_SAMPLE_ID=MMETSP0209 /ASSEMBLY_ACC=CAM_ASM_000301 /LENGTH=530 /DNA_ID=CAMNT_0010806515 /DNA_START=299 /DNA_END=1891 /DNA_ORIENTATION=-